MAIRQAIIDELLGKAKTEAELFGRDGLLKQLTKQLIESTLDAELSHHLGYQKNDPSGNNSGNSRNGKSNKTLKSDNATIELEIPRDRNGSFDPQFVKKRQNRLTGLNDQILSLYAKGMTTRDIESHLQEIYGSDVSRSLISKVTDSILEEVTAWRNRPLDATYPIVYIDGFVSKCRLDGRVENRTVYVVYGINLEGHKDVLGLSLGESEGAKYWLTVLTELKNRGLEDIFIICADGLKGLPESVEAAFPKTIFQTCIVHMMRNSLKYVPYTEKKAVAAAPAFIIIGRLLQGFSLGGELAGGIIFAFEHAEEKHRGLAVGFVASGYACGGFIGSFVCMIFTLSFMPEWGWRMPFILGFFISLFGLYIRKKLLETPEFNSIKKAEIEPRPLAKSLADNRLQLLVYFLFSGIAGTMYYMNFVYFIAFSKDFAIISSSQAQLYCSLGIGAAMLVQPILGAMADKHGVFVFMKNGLLALLAITILRYLFIPNALLPFSALCLSIAAGIAFATFLAGWYPYSLDMFDKKVRYSSAASASSAGLSLIAGTSPLVASYLMGLYNGHNLFIGYLSILAMLGIGTLMLVYYWLPNKKKLDPDPRTQTAY